MSKHQEENLARAVKLLGMLWYKLTQMNPGTRDAILLRSDDEVTNVIESCEVLYATVFSYEKDGK